MVKSAVLRTKDEYVHIADVPEYLVSALELDSAFNKLQPYWQNSFAVSESISFRRRLSNGIPVSFHQSRSEPRAVCISLFFPGGYSTEPAEYQGALDLGAKTLQEGGAFKNVSRESVELFCLDHTIMLEAVPRADGLLIDIKVGVDDQDQAAAHPIHNNTALSNLEAAMQVARILMTDFKWEISAFRRAKQLLVEQIKGADNSLELQCLKEVKKCVYYSNSSQRTPTIDDINRLNLQNIIDIMSAQVKRVIFRL